MRAIELVGFIICLFLTLLVAFCNLIVFIGTHNIVSLMVVIVSFVVFTYLAIMIGREK